MRTGHSFTNDFKVAVLIRNQGCAPGRFTHYGPENDKRKNQEQQQQEHAENDSEKY